MDFRACMELAIVGKTAYKMLFAHNYTEVTGALKVIAAKTYLLLTISTYMC